MSKEDIINYVMTTPSNSNRAVLSGMLDSIAQSGGTVEVERIFIANVNGSWTQSGTMAVFSGGTGFAETVADKIGGKTIIGFGIGAENERGENGIISLRVRDGNDHPLLGTKGEDVHGIGVFALKDGLGEGINQLAIYAICI